MTLPDIEFSKILPGAMGSLFSMLWIKDTWGRLAFMFFGGVAIAHYATPYTVKLTGFDSGIAGFLLGLFGMSVVASLFVGWQKLDMSIIFRDAIRALFRLPPVSTPSTKDNT